MDIKRWLDHDNVKLLIIPRYSYIVINYSISQINNHNTIRPFNNTYLLINNKKKKKKKINNVNNDIKIKENKRFN